MKRFIFLLILCIQPAVAQTIETPEQTPLDVDQFIGYDGYDNLYTITGMVLNKKGDAGVFRFTDFQLGAISSVDIINPLSVVVFYEQTNIAVLLDNKLTEIERINFNLLEDFANISTARNAGGNKLWLFNADSQQLEVYNYRLNTKNIISLPIAEIVTDQTSNFNYNFILTPTTIKVYTVFGGIITSIAFKGGEKIIEHNNRILVVKDSLLYETLESGSSVSTLKTTQISIQDLQLSKDFLYIYDRKNVHSFAIKKPKN
tara:strand:- start:1356 stop:2132 length:777 start_codon:yes stop_codon:yes gene_type:complete